MREDIVERRFGPQPGFEFRRLAHCGDLAAMQQMLGWIAEGKLRPLVSKRYALEDTAQALNDMAARKCACSRTSAMPES